MIEFLNTMSWVLKSYCVFFNTTQKIVCSLILQMLKKLCSLILKAVFYNLSSLFRFCCVRNYVLPSFPVWREASSSLCMNCTAKLKLDGDEELIEHPSQRWCGVLRNLALVVPKYSLCQHEKTYRPTFTLLFPGGHFRPGRFQGNGKKCQR